MIKKTFLDYEVPVYDITVENTHNFFANGVLVHNCAEIIEYSNAEESAVCFTENTMILTKNGIKKIIDCDGELVYVPFKSDTDLIRTECFEKAKLIKNGKRKVFKLETSGGIRIEATENHPFLIRTKVKYKGKKNNYKRNDFFEWKALKDIKIGDFISSPSNDCVYENIDNINYNLDYATAGWMLGDGWQRDNVYGVCFGPTEMFAQNIVLPIINKWHVESTTESKHSNDRQVTTFTNKKNGVVSWASKKQGFIDFVNDKFGFSSKLGKFKSIPYKIMSEAEPNEIVSFLSGLFSADGTVGYYNNKLYVGLSSASLDMLETCQMMLKLFGIHSRIVYDRDKRKEKKWQGHLNIHNRDQLVKYLNLIGFCLCPDKQNKLKELLSTIVENKKIFRHEHHKVKKITEISELEVYDLNLESGHNFIANGYVVHNCNLASISLPSCIEDKKDRKAFNFNKLYNITKTLTDNLNKVIDIEYYPVETAKNSNLKHRPIGIGIQGLADAFAQMRYSWESDDAKLLNSKIAETMYYAALEASCELAKKDGPYESYKGSPISKGIFQFDEWNIKPSDMWDWDALKAKIKKYGIRNSLLIAEMPTASTSQILGNTEAFEAITSNIYKRSTLSGEYIQINKYLVEDLMKLNLWTDEMRQTIISNNGSIQSVSLIPDDIKILYKTVWEISQRVIIDMAAGRGPFVCQSQSMNLYIKDPNFAKLTSALFYAWKTGLKTLVYYMRTNAPKDAVKITVDKELENKLTKEEEQEGLVCSLDNPESCEMCSG